jgi:ABC-type uncharacterized transport system fused permease/ATPase subunit
MSSLLQDVILTPITICYYTLMVFKLVGWEGVAIIYSHYVIGGLLSWLLAKTVVPAVLAQQAVEGDFRFLHVNARTHAQAVAFVRGEERERQAMDNVLGDLKVAMLRTVNRESFLSMVTSLVAFIGAILSYCIAAIPIFIKHKYDDLPPGDLARVIGLNAFFCLYLSNKLNSLVGLMGDMSEAAGYFGRVGLLWEYCEETIPTSPPETDQVAQVRNATIVTPKHEVLLENVNFEIKPTDRIVLTGGNGQGKSSILRVLAGLWNAPGYVALGKRVEPMFIPTIPHLPMSDFSGLVSYPDVGISLEAAEGYCTQVGLEPRGSGVLMPSEWLRLFSTGELQKLGLARALYTIDKRRRKDIDTFLFLDESLANTDFGSDEYNVLDVLFGDKVTGWLRVSHHVGQTLHEVQWRVQNGQLIVSQN